MNRREMAHTWLDAVVSVVNPYNFVDPISNVMNWPGTVHYNDVAPPRYKLGGMFYSSCPEMQECHDLARLPVDDVHIETIRMSNIS